MTLPSNDGGEDGSVVRTPTVRPDLRLRGEQPRVVRLSRKVLIGLVGAAALGVAGAMGYALQARNGAGNGHELYNTQSRPTADGLAALPKDYADIPRQVPPLGPPLPGDLGRPIISAGRTANLAASPGLDADEQRRLQEIEAARVSGLFVQNAQPPGASASMPNTPIGAGATAAASFEAPPAEAGSAQNMQDRKLAFIDAAPDRITASPDQLAPPVSPFVVQAGTVIPAALITGIRSDLPGQITAQVTEDVYDSPTGQYLLIPQGARLIGQYDSSVAFGQNRVLLVWTRLIMPNGMSIVLERLPGADTQGYAGLQDGVDNHWGMLFKAAVLSTLLSVGAEAGTSDSENNLAQAIRMGASNSISQTGQQILERQLNIQPTLTIRPGFPVRVLVTRDLVLARYRQGNTP
jgi:type IV secretion system protein VirB10